MMMDLLSESKFMEQTQKIKTAIDEKSTETNTQLGQIGTKLGVTVNLLNDVETAIDDELTAINTELAYKGGSQADDLSEVAEKIRAIGGSSALIVECNYNEAVTKWESTVTYGQIWEAYSQGIPVVIKLNGTYDTTIINVCYMYYNPRTNIKFGLYTFSNLQGYVDVSDLFQGNSDDVFKYKN